MSSKVIKTITIDGLNPKNGGVLDTEGNWRSLSKYGRTLDGKPLTTDLFSKGSTYQVEVAAGKTGGEFIAGIIGSANNAQASAPATASPSTNRIPAKVWDKETKPKSEGMSTADWAKKDFSQLIGGLSHDVAQMFTALLSTGAAVTADAALEKAVSLVVQGRKLLEEKMGE
jgi:hypothetical protein